MLHTYPHAVVWELFNCHNYGQRILVAKGVGVSNHHCVMDTCVCGLGTLGPIRHSKNHAIWIWLTA